jgi:hypothetical protein
MRYGSEMAMAAMAQRYGAVGTVKGAPEPIRDERPAGNGRKRLPVIGRYRWKVGKRYPYMNERQATRFARRAARALEAAE